MAWNDSGNGKNPWNQDPNQGPPDLDEVVKKMQEQLRSLFGGKGSSSGGDGQGFYISIIAVVAFAVLAGSGIYKLDQRERGIVLRFGALHAITDPGLHWRVPIVDEVVVVNIGDISQFNYKNQMLTEDEQIVHVDVGIQYRRSDPQAFALNVRDADLTLNEVSESAIREVVGKSTAAWVMGEGREELASSARRLAQETLDSYQTGIEVIAVNLIQATPPNQVQAAVLDATKAREDKGRSQNVAEAYENDILPRARGDAIRRVQDAEGYKARVVADAEGEASRFLALLHEYQRAPEVTRTRLYLETMEEVYRAVGKVFLDAEGSGNLLYLPVDKLMEQQGGSAAASVFGRGSTSQSAVSEKEREEEDTRRTRR